MIDVLPVEKLQAVAAMVKAPPSAKPSTSSNGNGAPFTNRLDVPRWLTAPRRGLSREGPARQQRANGLPLRSNAHSTVGTGPAAKYPSCKGRMASWRRRVCTTRARAAVGKSLRRQSGSPTRTIGTRHYPTIGRPRPSITTKIPSAVSQAAVSAGNMVPSCRECE